MSQSDTSDNKEQQREVCPDSIKPIHYRLKYHKIDFTEPFKFEGSVEIDLKVKQESSSITFNAHELELTKIHVSQHNKKEEIGISKIKHDADKEQITVPLQKKLAEGDAILSIDFIGLLNDKMKGFYRSKYQSSKNETVYGGVTQFESTDARRAFPCWDEPAVKATFSLEITAPKHLTVLSNMPHDKLSIDDDKKIQTISFHKSPIMSTYLLAWAIGEFEHVESKTSRDIIVRIWTTPGNKHKADFACEVACKALDFYEKYFEINYPLPKCDMLAVPDFSAGAMENWGLITYREVALLCERQKSSVRSLQYVAIVVCHELAHQWFGNLVTMDWWSQLWLNEGFACFMEYLSADAIFKDWKMWDMFIASEYNRAFELDGMVTSHPIEVDIFRAKEADEVFDAISYCKGASIIRMLQTYLGAETFRKALHKYLKNFEYKNAITNDLWEFLAKESNKPVANIMKNWTRDQGFPLITVTRKGDKITLSQSRYLSSGKPTEEQDKVIWNVPLSMKVSTGNDHKLIQILLNERHGTFEIPHDAKWVHLNTESTGFYVVSYDHQMMGSLIDALKHNDKNLSLMDRVVLIRDTKALASAGYEGLTLQLLNLIIACKHETSYPIWDSVISAAGDIRLLIDTDQKTANNFNAIMRDTLSEIYKDLSWDSKQNEDAQQAGSLRPLILSALAKYDDESVIKEAMKRFNEFMKNNNKDAIDPSLRSMVFSCSVKNGKKEEFELLRTYYLTTTDPADKSWSLRALGSTQTEELIEILLKWILESDEVRSQDKVFPFSVVGSHIKGREVAWKHLQKHWDNWFKLFDGGFMVQHLAKVPQYFVTFEKAEEIEKFYSNITSPQCQRAMKQCIENIKRNAQWREKNIKDIEKWSQQHAEKLKNPQ